MLTVKQLIAGVLYAALIICLVELWRSFFPQTISDVKSRKLENFESVILKQETGSNVRLLCFLLTDPSILKKAVFARDTWMKRCDVALFMSSVEDEEFPTVGLNVSAGRPFLSDKTKAALKYIYEHYLDEADFFMKADPDSYVAVEILKEYLKNCNTSEPEIYGHNMYYPGTPTAYKSGHYVAGAAVVLTKEALVRLVTRGMSDPRCLTNSFADDLLVCACLVEVGGYIVDTRDQFGKDTFLPPLIVDDIVNDKYNEVAPWYIDYRAPYGLCSSVECLSDHPIAFHYVPKHEFALFDYLFRIRLRIIQQHSIDLSHLRFNGTRYTKNV